MSVRVAPLLQRLASLPRPIRVGLIGMGAMGKGLLYQCAVTPGFECVAVADLSVEKAAACAESMGISCREVFNAAESRDAVGAGKLAVSRDGMLVAESGEIDVLIEVVQRHLRGRALLPGSPGVRQAPGHDECRSRPHLRSPLDAAGTRARAGLHQLRRRPARRHQAPRR